MNNSNDSKTSNTTDTAKNDGQPSTFTKKGESNNDAQTVKGDEAKPAKDTVVDPKQTTDDASGKSLR
jgi:hypothetical protein